MPQRRTISAYGFLAFPLGVLIVFTLAPTLAGLFLSLFRWSGAGPPVYVGLGNFEALARDRWFALSLRNTLAFVLLSVPPTVLLGFLLAVAVHARWFVGKTLARTLIFMPTIVSIIAVGFVWRWLLDDTGGFIPALLRWLGLSHVPNLLQDGYWPMICIVAVSVWRGVGFSMVLYLAALSNVNESLYEAAAVDGASRRQSLRHITWAQVAPMTVFLLVTGVIGALQVFDIVWAMSGGSETAASTVLNLYIYREFQQSRLGYAAAIGAVIFALTAAATAAQLFLLRRAWS